MEKVTTDLIALRLKMRLYRKYHPQSLEKLAVKMDISSPTIRKFLLDESDDIQDLTIDKITSFLEKEKSL